MNSNRKIPLNEIKKNLYKAVKYKKPDGAFRALLLCWIKHPKFQSPILQTLRNREKADGFMWLKDTEVISFSDYCGYKLY